MKPRTTYVGKIKTENTFEGTTIALFAAKPGKNGKAWSYTKAKEFINKHDLFMWCEIVQVFTEREASEAEVKEKLNEVLGKLRHFEINIPMLIDTVHSFEDVVQFLCDQNIINSPMADKLFGTSGRAPGTSGRAPGTSGRAAGTSGQAAAIISGNSLSGDGPSDGHGVSASGDTPATNSELVLTTAGAFSNPSATRMDRESNKADRRKEPHDELDSDILKESDKDNGEDDPDYLNQICVLHNEKSDLLVKIGELEEEIEKEKKEKEHEKENKKKLEKELKTEREKTKKAQKERDIAVMESSQMKKDVVTQLVKALKPELMTKADLQEEFENLNDSAKKEATEVKEKVDNVAKNMSVLQQSVLTEQDIEGMMKDINEIKSATVPSNEQIESRVNVSKIDDNLTATNAPEAPPPSQPQLAFSDSSQQEIAAPFPSLQQPPPSYGQVMVPISSDVRHNAGSGPSPHPGNEFHPSHAGSGQSGHGEASLQHGSQMGVNNVNGSHFPSSNAGGGKQERGDAASQHGQQPLLLQDGGWQHARGVPPPQLVPQLLSHGNGGGQQLGHHFPPPQAAVGQHARSVLPPQQVQPVHPPHSGGGQHMRRVTSPQEGQQLHQSPAVGMHQVRGVTPPQHGQLFHPPTAGAGLPFRGVPPPQPRHHFHQALIEGGQQGRGVIQPQPGSQQQYFEAAQVGPDFPHETHVQGQGVRHQMFPTDNGFHPNSIPNNGGDGARGVSRPWEQETPPQTPMFGVPPPTLPSRNGFEGQREGRTKFQRKLQYDERRQEDG